MLEIQLLKLARHRETMLRDFDPKTTTWIVSDLKAKMHLQRRLLKIHGALPEESVVRASEFWRSLYFRIFPERKILSMDLLVAVIRQGLKKSPYPWAQSSGAANQMFDFLSQMAGLLSHPEGHDRLGDWFRKNVSSYIRWGEWYLEGKRIWAELDEMGVLAPHWIPSVLTNQELPVEVWSRPLWIDLGPDLQPAEADLLRSLSVANEIRVFKPELEVKSDFQLLLDPYQSFSSAKIVDFEKGPEAKTPRILRRRLASQLSEIKDAVAQVRNWIEQGISPSEIGIIAPDLELYSPVLAPYLQKEGIPADLELRRGMSQFTDIVRWFSEMALRAKEVNAEDLEVALFSESAGFELAYEKFASLFRKIYSEVDLKRHAVVAQRFERVRDSVLSRDLFLTWAISQFPKEGAADRLEKIVKAVLGECPQSFELSLSDWIFYLQARTSRLEVGVPDSHKGVKCVSLDSADDLNLKAAYFMGLEDSALRKSEVKRVEPGEVLSLSAQFGFVFPNPAPQRLEFKGYWVVQQIPELILSFPATDFSGAALAPSLFWLDQGGGPLEDKTDQISVPGLTHWDSLQRNDHRARAESLGWTAEMAEQLNQSLSVDLGISELEPFGGERLKKISATGVERYKTCPFIYCAEQVFNLSSLPELDLDPDNMARGRLIHKALEILLEEPIPKVWSQDVVNEALIEAREEIQLLLADESSWRILQQGLQRLLLPLLEAESEWRRHHPMVKTVGRETPVQGFWDPLKKEFTRESQDGFLKFSGRIDRMDQEKNGSVAVLDYKSSASGLKQFGSWIESGHYQLGIYTAAIEAGLTPMGPAQVVAAYFYVVKTRERRYGFTVKDRTESFQDLGVSSRSLIDFERKTQFLREIGEQVSLFVDHAKAGRFIPQPQDVKTCKECQWRSLCRAPHLN